MNDLYDFRDDAAEAEQALKTACLEHAALGYENALDGSQVAQMLGAGLPFTSVYIENDDGTTMCMWRRFYCIMRD